MTSQADRNPIAAEAGGPYINAIIYPGHLLFPYSTISGIAITIPTQFSAPNTAYPTAINSQLAGMCRSWLGPTKNRANAPPMILTILRTLFSTVSGISWIRKQKMT